LSSIESAFILAFGSAGFVSLSIANSFTMLPKFAGWTCDAVLTVILPSHGHNKVPNDKVSTRVSPFFAEFVSRISYILCVLLPQFFDGSVSVNGSYIKYDRLLMVYLL
jgi:hypothetical protein